MSSFHVTLPDGLAKMPGPYGDHYAVMLQHGTLEVGLYAPRKADPQTPHTRDEVYVVMRGSGWFRRDDERVAFSPGDVLFVPAHHEHRFEDFTDDLAVWVFFYGPQGGEVAAREGAKK